MAMVVNWEAIGALAELAGALGVVGSLVYLAIQIRSNTKQLKFAATQSVGESIDRAFDPIYTEPCLSIWYKGHQDLESLSPSESAAFRYLLGRQLHNFSNLIYAEAEGVIDSRRSETLYHEVYRDLFSSPGAKQWLAENEHVLDAGVVTILRKER